MHVNRSGSKTFLREPHLSNASSSRISYLTEGRPTLLALPKAILFAYTVAPFGPTARSRKITDFSEYISQNAYFLTFSTDSGKIVVLTPSIPLITSSMSLVNNYLDAQTNGALLSMTLRFLYNIPGFSNYYLEYYV